MCPRRPPRTRSCTMNWVRTRKSPVVNAGRCVSNHPPAVQHARRRPSARRRAPGRNPDRCSELDQRPLRLGGDGKGEINRYGSRNTRGVVRGKARYRAPSTSAGITPTVRLPVGRARAPAAGVDGRCVEGLARHPCTLPAGHHAAAGHWHRNDRLKHKPENDQGAEHDSTKYAKTCPGFQIPSHNSRANRVDSPRTGGPRYERSTDAYLAAIFASIASRSATDALSHLASQWVQQKPTVLPAY